jgi:hypothetical protein
MGHSPGERAALIERRWRAAWLAAACLAVVACSRFKPRQTTAGHVEGGQALEGGARTESFEGAFSDIVAADERTRSVLLARNATESEPLEFVLIGIDDGRILQRGPTPPSGAQTLPSAGGDSKEKPPFTTTKKRTPTWEPDGTYDVCFLMRSSGRSKKVDCMKAVTGWWSRCDGGICTLFAASNPGPIVFTLVDEGTGDVLGSGSLMARSLDYVATRNGRVALRFGVSQAVIDLGAKKIFERIPAPDETGMVHPLPIVWFGDDNLLSCQVDLHADRHRSCKRIELLPLANVSKWRMAPEYIRFEFATKR